MVSNEVYLLPLNDDGSPNVAGQYVYIAPKTHDPVTIRFTIEGTSSICRHGSLWVNIPEQGDDFDRHKFREFPYVYYTHIGSTMHCLLSRRSDPLYYYRADLCPTSPAT